MAAFRMAIVPGEGSEASTPTVIGNVTVEPKTVIGPQLPQNPTLSVNIIFTVSPVSRVEQVPLVTVPVAKKCLT